MLRLSILALHFDIWALQRCISALHLSIRALHFDISALQRCIPALHRFIRALHFDIWALQRCITAPSELITELALERSAAKLMPKGTTVLAITGATLGQVKVAAIKALIEAAQ